VNWRLSRRSFSRSAAGRYGTNYRLPYIADVKLLTYIMYSSCMFCDYAKYWLSDARDGSEFDRKARDSTQEF
jgi:hypothetical protein